MDLLDNGTISPSFLRRALNLKLTSSAGALSVKNLKRIVIDASHIDQKKRGVMDMKDTMIPLAKWLSRKEFRDRYTEEEDQVDLMFY